MRTITLALAVFIIYMALSNFFGASISMFALSAGAFALSIFVAAKEKNFNKYLLVVNPGYIKNLSKKGKVVQRQSRITNALCVYMLSLVLFMNGYIGLRHGKNISKENLVMETFLVCAILFVLTLVLYLIANFRINKNRIDKKTIITTFIVGSILFVVLLVFVYIMVSRSFG